ncbi:MAG: glycoside hydrolase family 18 protein [Bacteroidota bacterium]
MRYLSLLVIPLLFVACEPQKSEPEVVDTSTAVMAYYVPKENYQPRDLPLEQLTHIIYSFTHVIDGEMAFRNEEKAGPILSELVAQRDSAHSDLKVMIACGGWGADGFSDMALTPETRKAFVESAVAFNKKYGLDGLDIDWEYPSISGAGTMARPEDKENFTALMQELRAGLDQLDRAQTLTFASAGWERYYDNIELDKVMPVIDYMNVMTYDQVTIYTPYTGHHTPLGWIRAEDIAPYPAIEYVKDRQAAMAEKGLSWSPGSAEHITNFCMENGIDPQKIVIGAAFYGRAWKGVPPQGNGLYQPNSGAHIGWSGYSQIRDEFEEKNGYTRYWDSIAQAPYLYNPADSIFISYDDTVSVRMKTEFVQDNGLGGIMFWQLSNDTREENNLLDAIHAAATR